MSDFIILLVLIGLFTFGVRCYLNTTNQPSLEDIERKAAADLEPRSHHLCMRACNIDLMPHDWHRMRADDEWRDELHQYVSDFEEQVACRAKAGNVKELQAYGGIKLLKKGA